MSALRNHAVSMLASGTAMGGAENGGAALPPPQDLSLTLRCLILLFSVESVTGESERGGYSKWGDLA